MHLVPLRMAPTMQTRREFLSEMSQGVAAVALYANAGVATPQLQRQEPLAPQSEFRRRFAPHLGMFRHLAGDDPIDQIRFMADQGFRAFEDNGLMHRPRREQERIARELERHGMRLGLFIGSADFGNATFASGRADFQARVIAEVARAAETARRWNASGFIVVPGRRDSRLPDAVQRRNGISLLKRCAEICERADARMLIEPLNHWGQRPQMFLHSAPQAAEICRAVGSNGCRMLYDVYHHAANGTVVIEDVARCFHEIGYFQIGDYPGRKEPGTGAFDFGMFFRWIDARGYDGLFGMEHGNSLAGGEGERAVIAAYRALEQIA